jgi:FAD/FMN-containing dehydrogenase
MGYGPDPTVVPVVLLAFNRPAHTAQVWESIRAARPRQLLVAVDGPRSDVASDAANCQAVRVLVGQVDWPCELHLRFSTDNRGCRHGPAESISWAFERVNQAIILEDDCVPHPTFYRFCAELLDRHHATAELMGIGGHRWEGPDLQDADSYYFSRYPNTWGWATWADRWRAFDLKMRAWPDLRKSDWLDNLLQDEIAVSYWQKRFDAMVSGLDAWDYAWLFAIWKRSGLWIRPNLNLVQNIGFGPAATHTYDPHHPAGRTATAMPFPLRHPEKISIQPANEALLEWVNFSGILKRQLRQGAKRIAALRQSNSSP